MAITVTANCIGECNGGSDNNSFFFDPAQTAGMLTDGAATSATGTSPLFSSVSYSFVAGDVNHYIYVASGTNWISAWYKIASVSGGVATLSAVAGVPVLKDLFNHTTTNGCATTASPTGATWTIDYTRSTSAPFTFTSNLSAVGTTTLTGVGFGKQMVGNAVNISGQGFYIFTAVASSVSATVNTTLGTFATTSGILGGGAATYKAAIVQLNTSCKLFIQYNSGTVYPNATTTTLGAAGTTSAGNNALCIIGYNTDRTLYNGDSANRPILQASGSTQTMLALGANSNVWLRNIVFDGNKASFTAITLISGTGASDLLDFCVFKNASASNYLTWSTNFPIFFGCESFGHSASGSNMNSIWEYCWIHDMTTIPNTSGQIDHCIFSSITGASTDCCNAPAGLRYCTFFNIGRDAIFGVTNPRDFINNIFYTIGRYVLNVGTTMDGAARMINNAYGNLGTAVTNDLNKCKQINCITLTVDPFVASGSNDFRLNNTSGGGAAARAAGLNSWAAGVFPATGYADIGAIQHQDAGVSGYSRGRTVN